MHDIIMRLIALLLIGALSWLLVRCGQSYIARRMQRVLAAEPSSIFTSGETDEPSPSLRILAFSGPNCQQCKLQEPILQRVVEAWEGKITVTKLDAPSVPELTERYQVLTVPTTVLLDASGKARAINYGFTNTKHILEQIDTILS